MKIKEKLLLKILTLKFYYFKVLCKFGRHKRLYFLETKKLPLYDKKSILKRDFKAVDFFKCKICGKAVGYERS